MSGGALEYSRKQEEIKRYAILDGCYVITTDVAAKSMDKEEVRGRYKSLAQVEQAFRAMKSDDLMLRPIRHWTPKRVEGHVFMCMLAYLVTWQARRRLAKLLRRNPKTRECEGDSLREIWRTLHKIKLGRIDAEGEDLTDISILTPPQQNILKALNAQVRNKERIRLGLCRQEKRHRKK